MAAKKKSVVAKVIEAVAGAVKPRPVAVESAEHITHDWAENGTEGDHRRFRCRVCGAVDLRSGRA